MQARSADPPFAVYDGRDRKVPAPRVMPSVKVADRQEGAGERGHEPGKHTQAYRTRATDRLLNNYVLERLHYRPSQTKHHDRFISERSDAAYKVVRIIWSSRNGPACSFLDFPAPHFRAYARETVIAEKFQAMVMLGRANSRMKDLYDVWVVSRNFEFKDGKGKPIRTGSSLLNQVITFILSITLKGS